MPDFRILVINPGSTSTKIAVFDNNKEVFKKTLNHNPEELSPFEELIDQFEFRKKIVEKALEENNIPLDSLDAIVSRGGLLRPVPSGVFIINEQMLADLKDPTICGRVHASNLGAFIAKSISEELHIPCYVADPVTVDEMEDIARISGVPGIVRQSLFHALNIRAIARKTAKKLNKTLDECNLIAAHMGGGVSVAAIKQGKVVDVNNAVVRWLLHDPGYHSGKIYYDRGEYHIRYNHMVKPFHFPDCHLSERMLEVVEPHLDLFNTQDAPPVRTGSAYCIRKGQGKPLVHQLEGSTLVDGMLQ